MASGGELEECVRQGLIERLQKRSIVELEQVRHFHGWLDDKRVSRQSGRVVGESRTGKTLSCEAYQLKYPPSPENGAMRVPIVYWQAVPESSNRDLFTGILEGLQYQIQRGTLSEIRARVLRLLHICQVEMLLIDESHRLRSKALADLQDILDKLQIAIILVGTDTRSAQATPTAQRRIEARRAGRASVHCQTPICPLECGPVSANECHLGNSCSETPATLPLE